MDKGFKNLKKDSSSLRETRRADRVELRKKDKDAQAMKRRQVGAAVLEDAALQDLVFEATGEPAELREIYEGLTSEVCLVKKKKRERLNMLKTFKGTFRFIFFKK